MTTDTATNEKTAVPKPNRTAEYIIDHGIPLSECNENELNAVIEYRAQIKAREVVFQQQIKEAQEANAKIVASSAASAAKLADQLEQIKNHALKAYEASVSGNV